MIVNKPDREPFRKVAEAKIWPQYKGVNPELWDLVLATPS